MSVVEGLWRALLSIDWQGLLELVNVVLASGIAIVSCAFLLYILIYSTRNEVAQSFAGLVAWVLVAYFADVALFGVQDVQAALPWLRLQWLGIAFTPASYLHFSDALLVSTGDHARWRRIAVKASYVLSALLLLVAISTNLVVAGGVMDQRAPHLLPGPLFPLFVCYFLAAVGWGAANVLRARKRCLTSTSRRRMGYLAVTFAAPAAGVFPYLLLTGWPASAPGTALWLLLVLGNIGIGLMLVLLAYSVAFFGALTPDRVVKHRLVHFLLRGPMLAILIVIMIVAASRAEGWLGLPSRRAMLFGVVGVTLLFQLGIELAKPLIDRALYRQDQPEIEWIQELSNRLLTTTDLRQFLENVLTALCDLLRVETTFVAVIEDGKPHLEVVCGQLDIGSSEQLPTEAWGWASPDGEAREGAVVLRDDLFVWNGYWLVPLRTETDGQEVLGVVGMTARAPEPNLTAQERAGMDALLAQVIVALEDRRLQQSIFGALDRMIPEIEDIQRRRGAVRYVGEEALTEFDMVEDQDFRQWVRDALSHYWGGPKLSNSPLLALRIVERAAQQFDDNVMQGLREVLKQAIERLRPDGKREMTRPEWVLYNILDLKFLEGRSVREVARRLAMSESDLYRKQRVAIEAVAQVLAEMERAELRSADDARAV
ncbi:MAG: hypothetical protein GX601_10440 [Anaerolineales bacterium]|nr:hypothetical protein [Anaerolineales bacterium]